MLKKIVEDIAGRINTPVPNPDEQGYYTFNFNDGLNVSVFQYDDTTVFASPLNVSAEEKDQLVKLLQWQLARAKEYDEILSFDPAKQQFFLYKQLSPSKLSERSVLEHLEIFLNNLDYWKSISNPDSNISSAPNNLFSR